MQATFTKTEHTGKIAYNRREKAFSNEYAVLVNTPEGIRNPIIARFYWTATRCYACVWINASEKGVHVSGGGYAGGYGYHKASAALESALEDAGILLSEDIGGRGESAMLDALKAVAVALGYAPEAVYIHHAHA